MSLNPTSTRLLDTSRDGDSTTSLGSLFQCSTTLSAKKFFIISSLKLPWHNLRLFPLVMVTRGWLLGLPRLVTWEKRPTPSSRSWERGPSPPSSLLPTSPCPRGPWLSGPITSTCWRIFLPDLLQPLPGHRLAWTLLRRPQRNRDVWFTSGCGSAPPRIITPALRRRLPSLGVSFPHALPTASLLHGVPRVLSAAGRSTGAGVHPIPLPSLSWWAAPGLSPGWQVLVTPTGRFGAQALASSARRVGRSADGDSGTVRAVPWHRTW